MLQHDRQAFDIPSGWAAKPLEQSPLLTDFPHLWLQLKDTYKRELSALAFSPIPHEAQVATQFIVLTENII